MSMKIFVIGGGGREHALVWKIAQSPLCEHIYCAPGNPGISQLAECVDISIQQPFDELVSFCESKSIDLVVVGPERPLAEGVVNALKAAGFATFGPTSDGAQVEASKTYAKQLMLEYGIPTAGAVFINSYDEAIDVVADKEFPLVIKASGLAEGKGVIVAHNRGAGLTALRRMLEDKVFGDAGNEVLIEDCLVGEEASMLAFVDGKTIKVMDSAQDHKPVFDGDEGPNTGGMGSYSPAPVITPELRAQIEREVFAPFMTAMIEQGIHYVGVLYAGLMITEDGPKVIEFNCRFGDPETQALLPRLESDLVEVMLACVEGRLAELDLKWSPNAAVSIVAASGGYPGAYEKGKLISGLEKMDEGAMVFHAGTRQQGDGIVTSGGRVLAVTGLAPTIEGAIGKAYENFDRINFEGKHSRRDIGHHALRRER